jgi:hypothetical protein
LYQRHEDDHGFQNVTTVPNFGFKAGFSYAANGLTASVFDAYDGNLPYGATLNPAPDAHHLINSHLRLDLSRYWHADAARGVAFFIHGDNLANEQVWMPDLGGNTGDTIPVSRGRTVYFGMEFALGKAPAVTTR